MNFRHMNFRNRYRKLLRCVFVAILSMIGSVAISSLIHAHDLAGIIHVLNSPDVPESVRSFNRIYALEGNAETRAVLVSAFQWLTPAKITVCFDKGTADLRPKIAQAMSEWSELTNGNITFVFSELNKIDKQPSVFRECDKTTLNNIRIGFVKGDGNWSQIGTLSYAVFPKNSMNLDFDKEPRPDDQTIRELTLHEVGHAMGFHHEHQSPGAPGKNWAWDRILIEYQWPGKTTAEKIQAMHANLDRLNDYVLTTGQHAYVFSAYDQVSIMHYSFPPIMFSDGQSNPCYITQPHELSPTDKRAMKDAYLNHDNKIERTRSINVLLGDSQFAEIHELLKRSITP